MYYPRETDFDNPRDYKWLKTALMTVFVAVMLSTATTAGTVLWSERSSPADQTGSYDPTASQQMPEPLKLGSSALEKPTDDIRSDQDLQKVLDEFVNGQNANFGIYVENLQTAQTGLHELDRPFTAHQTAHLFVAHEIFRELDTGLLTSSQSAGEASGLTIQQCLAQMLTSANRECASGLGDIIGWEKRNDELARVGYQSTDLSRGQATTTARDIAKIFKNLAEGRHLSPESRETFLGLLRNQPTAERIALGLPQPTQIVHHTGGVDSYFHDGGIVYSYGGHYIIVILSGQWRESEPRANHRLGELSQKIYGYFNN